MPYTRRTTSSKKRTSSSYSRSAHGRKKPMTRRAQYVEPIMKEVLCSYVANSGADNKVSMATAVRPDKDAAGGTTPLWPTILARYDEFRVKMFVMDIILEQSDRPGFSVIDRDATVKAEPSNFVKDRNHRLHTLTQDNKKVTLMWKPTTSSDYDFKNTGDVATSAPAFLHFLQTGLADVNPKAEVRIKCYIDCRGQKN